ncbi:MAG TPA: ABC transporter permease [Candidatus Polarisedimenticolia bacterium]|nr:ABC transporter permease [Candidatus Polarisedimenticolia bacterium]
MSTLASLLRSLFRKSRLDRDLDSELRFHIEAQAEANLVKGMTPEQARREALISLGGFEPVREEVRQARPGIWLETLWRDVCFGARMLRKNPGFTSVAVLTLALAIGANTALFSVVYAVQLRGLPYPGADRIMMLWEKSRDGESTIGYPTFADWQAQNHTIEAMAAMSDWDPILSAGETPEMVQGASVTPDFFRVLGVGPMLGRTFTDKDGPPTRVAILSHRLWKERFHADPSLIGKPIRVYGVDRTVIGVMPPDFQPVLTPLNERVDIWRPLGYQGEEPPACRTCRHLRIVARLRSGVTAERATADLDAISGGMKRAHPGDYDETGAILEPLAEQFTGPSRTALYVLLGAVGFVLLVACANVANLLLVRSLARGKEFVLRAALGAGRARLARQLVTESLLLAAAGGFLGVLLAAWGTRALLALSPANLPRIEQAGLNAPVLLFTLSATVVTGIFFGVAPALYAARSNAGDSLRQAGRATSGPRQHRLRKILVVMNVALALVLLTGAGLTLNSLVRLLSVDPGFARERVLTMTLSIFGPRYLEDDADKQALATYRSLLERIAAIPGVRAAGMVSQLPLGGNIDRYGVLAQDKPLANPEKAPAADRYAVTPGYLEAMQIPLRRGRTLTEQDSALSGKVVLVNESLAREIWAGEDPIDKLIRVGGPDAPWRRVVGVVGDIHHSGLDDGHRLQFYAPEEQWNFVDYGMSLAVRTAGDPTVAADTVRKAVWSVTPDVLITDVRSIDGVIEASVAHPRFTMILLGFFAATALLLAAMGIYGVASFGVTQRTQEIGTRMALGALPRDVLRLTLGEGMALLLSGVFIGIAGALALTRFLRSLLFEISPTEPSVFLAVALLLCMVGAAACYLPARRATRIDPVTALRYE